MRKPFIIAVMVMCLAAIITSHTAWAADTTPAEIADKIVGDYEGKIHNRRAGVPITTSFFKDGDGNLVGGYVIKEGANTFKGKLSNISIDEDNTMQCKWRSKDGWGSLKVDFSQDFRKFSGYYKGRTGTGRYSWTGVKDK